MNNMKLIKDKSVVHKTISYKQLWVLRKLQLISTMNGCSLTKGYSIVDKYILSHFNNGVLNMTNQQILNDINCHLKHGSISIHTVTRAITNLRSIVLTKNGKPFISRYRKGRYGKQVSLVLNPILMPKGDLNKSIKISSYKIDPITYKINQLKNELKIVKRQKRYFKKHFDKANNRERQLSKLFRTIKKL